MPSQSQIKTRQHGEKNKNHKGTIGTSNTNALHRTLKCEQHLLNKNSIAGDADLTACIVSFILLGQ